MSPESLQNCEQFLPATQAELSRFVAENAGGKKSALYPVGGRTALQLAVPAAASSIILSTAKLDKIVDYPARDMTITVEAGIRIDTLAAALKAENQQLPIDAPSRIGPPWVEPWPPTPAVRDASAMGPFAIT